MTRPANGTEGDAWMAAWCATCIHEEDCPILLEGLTGGDPHAWHPGPMWSPQTIMFCTQYDRHRQ